MRFFFFFKEGVIVKKNILWAGRIPGLDLVTGRPGAGMPKGPVRPRLVWLVAGTEVFFLRTVCEPKA